MWNIIYKYGNLIESDSMATLYGVVMENYLSRGVNDEESLIGKTGERAFWIERTASVKALLWTELYLP